METTILYWDYRFPSNPLTIRVLARQLWEAFPGVAWFVMLPRWLALLFAFSDARLWLFWRASEGTWSEQALHRHAKLSGNFTQAAVQWQLTNLCCHLSHSLNSLEGILQGVYGGPLSGLLRRIRGVQTKAHSGKSLE